MFPVSPDCVFDASLVPETCLGRFVDLKGLTQQVSGERVYRPVDVLFKDFFEVITPIIMVLI
jgi:hypothetical protein